MADEDELFAQFLGEINSAVAEPVEDGGGASDTASVGEIEGGDTIAEDTARRKASTETTPLALPAAKKPKVTGKLVAAALPMKAGTASAVAPKPAASRVEATKSLADSGPSARPTSNAAKVSKDGSAGYGNSGAVEPRKDGTVAVPAGNPAFGEKHGNGGAPRGGDARRGGGDGRMLPEANGAHRSSGIEGMQGQHPGASQLRGHMGIHHSQMPGAMMPGNNGMGMPPGGGMGMNMGMMGDGIRGDYGGGYGMPPVMNMDMRMGMGMGMAPGMDAGPYAGGSVGYVYGGQINGIGQMVAGGVEGGTAAAMGAAAAAAEERAETSKEAKGKRKETKADETGAKKFKRVAGGTSWEDTTLADWPENDYRLFVGDLGNEVTDEHLAGVFRKYVSFAKARVIREKWNKKSKGYGFVSFVDGMDMLKALREQNGKYLGNRPMKISKSTWKDRDAKEVRKKNKKAKKVKKQLGML